VNDRRKTRQKTALRFCDSFHKKKEKYRVAWREEGIIDLQNKKK